VAQY